MAELVKKLNIKKNGETTSCSIYSTVDEAGAANIKAVIDNTTVYIPLVQTGNDRASSGRISNANNIQAIATTAQVPYGKVEYKQAGTYTFTVPSGITELSVEIAGAGGGMQEVYKAMYSGGNGDLQNIKLEVSSNEVLQITVGARGKFGAWAGVNSATTATDGNLSKIVSRKGEYIAEAGTSGECVGEKDGKNGVSAGNGLGGKGGFGTVAGQPITEAEDGWVVLEWGNISET